MYYSGATPFGYRAELNNGVQIVRIHEDEARLIRVAFSQICSGEPISRVAEEAGLTVTGLMKVLRSESLRGVTTQRGRIVRDESGAPLRHAAILSEADFTELQRLITSW